MKAPQIPNVREMNECNDEIHCHLLSHAERLYPEYLGLLKLLSEKGVINKRQVSILYRQNFQNTNKNPHALMDNASISYLVINYPSGLASIDELKAICREKVTPEALAELEKIITIAKVVKNTQQQSEAAQKPDISQWLVEEINKDTDQQQNY